MKLMRSCLLVLLALSMCTCVLVGCKKESGDAEITVGETLPCAEGHTPGTWTTVTEATRTQNGLREQVCAVCGEVINSEVISALGFDIGVTFSESVTTFDLSNCKVIYPDGYDGGHSFSKTFIGSVEKLAKRIADATGSTVHAYKESKAPVNDAYEILVGTLDEKNSADLAESFEGDGYAIRVVENKILIQGTTNLLTMEAVELFIDKYLRVDSPKSEFEIHNAVDSDPVDMIVFGTASSMRYTIVRSASLDNDPSVEYGTGNGNYVDYTVSAVGLLKDSITSITGYSSARVTVDTMKRANRELIVGHTSREESTTYRNLLQGHEYGIFIADDNIVLTAWSDANLQACVNRFIDYLRDNCYTKNGVRTVVLPATYMEKGVAKEGWKTDFPRPELPLIGAIDVENDSYQYVYMGEGVNSSAYEDYCNVLKNNGYSVLMQSGNVEDSYFTTFVNRENKTSLHVSYNAYKHADELPDGEKYEGAVPTIRIISSNTDTAVLPDDSMLKFTPFEPSSDSASSLTAVSMSHPGAGYVMRLEDGSFIVMDGGLISVGNEVDNLYNILVALHRKAWGRVPSEANPIRIRAWVISHAHGDHYGVFAEFAKKYGKSGLVELDYLVGNFPGEVACNNVAESDMTMLNNMEQYRRSFSTPFNFLKVHSGQRFWLANVELEVLFTHEDHYPQSIMAFNDTSTVIRFHVFNTNGNQVTPDSKETSFTFTGDLYRYGGRWLCAMYGDYLHSDMISLAHHGGLAVESFFYQKVAATSLWVPNNTSGFNSWLIRNDWTGKSNKTAITHPTVKYAIFADYKSDSKYKNVTIDIKADGADYLNAYNAGGSGQITFANISKQGTVSANAQIGKRT